MEYKINSSNYRSIARIKKREEPLMLHWNGTAGREKKMVDPETKRVLTVEEVTNYYAEGCATYTEGDMWAVISTGNVKLQQYLKEANRKKPGSVRQTCYTHAVGVATYRVLLREWEAIEAELCEKAMKADNVVQLDANN